MKFLVAIKTNKNMSKLKNQFAEKFKQHHHVYTKLKVLKNAWEGEKSQASGISRKKINKNDIIVLSYIFLQMRIIIMLTHYSLYLSMYDFSQYF